MHNAFDIILPTMTFLPRNDKVAALSIMYIFFSPPLYQQLRKLRLSSAIAIKKLLLNKLRYLKEHKTNSFCIDVL
jgi:hypothetical protein